MVRCDGVIGNRDYRPLKDSLSAKAKPISYLVTAEILDRFSQALLMQVASGPLTLELDKDTPLNLSVPVNAPKLWSPATPDLYQVRLSLVKVEGKTRTVLSAMSASPLYGSRVPISF